MFVLLNWRSTERTCEHTTATTRTCDGDHANMRRRPREHTTATTRTFMFACSRVRRRIFAWSPSYVRVVAVACSRGRRRMFACSPFQLIGRTCELIVGRNSTPYFRYNEELWFHLCWLKSTVVYTFIDEFLAFWVIKRIFKRQFKAI